jgi:hypothetical protein
MVVDAERNNFNMISLVVKSQTNNMIIRIPFFIDQASKPI